MAVQKSQSSLLAKLGNKLTQAHVEHKDDAPDYGNQTLPGGIEHGVAQLRECKIDLYKEGDNKGHPYFLASGIVVHSGNESTPEIHEGVKITGLRTQIGPEALCDTPNAGGERKTFSDHYAWFTNHLRILGFDVANIDVSGVPEAQRAAVIEQGLMAGMEALKTQQPYFNFRTWKGKKQEIEQRSDGKFYVGKKGPYGSEAAAKALNPYVGTEPRVNHEWNGACDFSANGDMQTSGVTDNQVRSQSSQATQSQPNGTAQTEATAVSDESVDLDDLAKLADEQNAEAQAKLQEVAFEAGVTEQEYTDAVSFQAIAELTKSKLAEASGEGTETQESNEPAKEWAPEVNDHFKYKIMVETEVMNAKTKKKEKKKVEKDIAVEVVTVDEKTKTVTLKNVANPKLLYKGVKWDLLIRE